MIALAYVGVGLGAGLVIVGAAIGIGRIGGQAVEGMSRQPEVAGNIQTAMIIAAALIEGIALFALVIMFQAGGTIESVMNKFAPQAATATAIEQSAEN